MGGFKVNLRDNWTVYNKWSPLIPKKGEDVQIQFEEDGEVFETEVLFRCVNKSRRTFSIWVRWPLEADGRLGLNITPDAGPGHVDKAQGLRPSWQTIPKSKREPPQGLKLFLKG